MLSRSRSGAPPRFLIFAGPYDAFLGKLVPNALLYALALAVVIGLGALGTQGVRRLLDPAHPTRALTRPLTAPEQQAGLVRTTGRVVALSPGDVPPVCAVAHEYYVSGKNGGWRQDWASVFNRGAKVVTPQGQTLSLSSDQIVFTPKESEVSTRGQEWSRKRFFNTGRFVEQCVTDGETVFVDGCAIHGALSPCSTGSSIVITTGDGSPQRRIDEAAATSMSRVGWLGISLWIVLLWIARLVKARPLASALIERFSKPAPTRAWAAGALVSASVFVFLLALAFNGCGAGPRSDAAVSRAGHGLGAVVLATLVITLIVLAQRRRALADALRPIMDRQTVPLARVSGDLVELAVRVHPQAPVYPGPLSGEQRAWWALAIQEEYTEGKSTKTVPVRELFSQPGVPVIDESGDGMLELAGAKLDVRSVGMSVRPMTWGDDARRIRPLLDTLPKNPRHVRFIVEESFVMPAEALYALGRVERVHADQARAGYRHAPTTTVVRSVGDAKLFVHAGSERSLVSGLRLESTLASAMVWALGAMTMLMAGVQLWLATR